MDASKGEVPEDYALRTADLAADGETIVSAITFRTDAFSVYTVVKVNSSTDIASGGPYALVTGIANDPGATTGYQENWGRDYFTIIVNANAMSNKAVQDGNGNNVAFVAEGVHAWTDGTDSYVGGEVPEVWEFVRVPNSNKYYIKVAGTNYYIDHHYGDRETCSLSTQWKTEFTVTRNSDGTVSFSNNGWYLCNNGNGEWGSRDFRFQRDVSGQERAKFRLCKQSNDFDSVAARKVSASELSANDRFIIFRKFVDENGGEQLYALASDGSFVRVYDGGDTVYWRETNKNIYWNYLMEGSYYSIFSENEGTRVYLNPMASTGDTINTTPSRLSLFGKDYGEYSTAIENWDQAAYDYAGLHVTVDGQGNATLYAGTRSDGTSDAFLFAVASSMPGAQAETVATVDSEALGVHITVFDYARDDKEYSAGTKLQGMTDIAGNDEYTPHAAHALVKPYLESGVPSSTTKGAMTGLFSSNPSSVIDGAATYVQSGVTGLFLKSYYDESGMFRYRSEDNFAYLGKNGNRNFTVYRQAATPYTTDKQPGHSYYYHGHYMPFNDIDMTQHVGRLMNQYGNEYTNGQAVGELPIGDGRTYEEIYGTKGIPNFYTGMKLEANFVQPKGGKLENGDDMVFKFTGDDDMWVYIDDVLVLDIGGIHEPLSGTINFATGAVTNPTGSSLAGTKTLYQIFQAVLNNSSTPQTVKDKIRAITWKDVNGDGTPDTFADYSNHSFKAFYMERGAGASNLDLQFNLKVVHANQFSVKKELPEGIDARFANQEYRFQATYMDNGTEKPLYAEAKNANNKVVCAQVVYKGRKDDQGQPVPVQVDENGYFTLRAGEEAVFMMLDEEIRYSVKEVDINGNLIERVQINDQDVNVVDGTASSGDARVRDRSQVNFKNWPYTQNLLITKHITADSLEDWQSDNPTFEFRVYLETTVTENGASVRKLVPYSQGPYYLYKMINGEKHYFTLTGTNNAPVDKGTTPVVCGQAGRSGSISSIPPEYTIEIPNLIVGTNFYVEERRDNIPAPYEFVREELTNGTYDEATNNVIERILASGETDGQEFDPDTIGRIKKGVDAESHIYNRKPIPHITITIKKVDKSRLNDDPEQLLQGATFKLTRYTDNTFTSVKPGWGDNGSMTLADTKQGDTYTLNGTFVFSQVPPGYYELDEIKLPAGYIKMSSNPRFQVTNDLKVYLLDEDGRRIAENSTDMVRVVKAAEGQQATDAQQEAVIVVANNPGVALPNTGGPGTGLVYAIGAGLLLLAAVGLALKVKKREDGV